MRAALTLVVGTMCMIVAGCNGGGAGDDGADDVPGTGGSNVGAAGAGGGSPTVPGTGGSVLGGAGGNAGTGGVAGVGGIAGVGGTNGGGTTGAGGSGAITGTGGAAGAPAAAAAGTIVPLYTPPSDASWTAIAAAKQAHPRVPVIAIVNPANGPSGARDPGYATGIGKLQLAGITVIGYVATGYTARGIAAVEADIDRWKSLYPAVQGIFFDEQSNHAGDEGFYRLVSDYAKSKGLSFTVGNPGADTGPSFVGAVDVGLIYESRGLPSAAALTGWHSNFPRTNFGIIPYGVALDHAYVKQAKAHVGYIYLNNDTLPNPWDSLPPYFADLLADLE